MALRQIVDAVSVDKSFSNQVPQAGLDTPLVPHVNPNGKVYRRIVADNRTILRIKWWFTVTSEMGFSMLGDYLLGQQRREQRYKEESPGERNLPATLPFVSKGREAWTWPDPTWFKLGRSCKRERERKNGAQQEMKVEGSSCGKHKPVTSCWANSIEFGDPLAFRNRDRKTGPVYHDVLRVTTTRIIWNRGPTTE